MRKLGLLLVALAWVAATAQTQGEATSKGYQIAAAAAATDDGYGTSLATMQMLIRDRRGSW